jgi:hypothetical protein
MSTIFSASNFILVETSVDVSAPGTWTDVYQCPSNKYCDMYIQSVRPLVSIATGSIHVAVGVPDGVGGFMQSYYLLKLSGGTSVWTSGGAITGRAHLLSSVPGSPGINYQTPVGGAPGALTNQVSEYLDPVRLLAGQKIQFFNGNSGNVRFTLKYIEYSST